MGIELDPGEVVKGVPACPQETNQPIKAPLTPRNLQHGLRHKPKTTQSSDECQVQGLELRVERDVQESENGSALGRARPRGFGIRKLATPSLRFGVIRHAAL